MDDRPVIGVAVINGGRQQLDPVAVRIEQVNIVRMAQAVSAGPELDVLAIAQPAGEVAGADDIVNAADDVAVMMQGGSGSTDEHHVVHRVLDVQEYADRLSGHDHVVHDAEAKIGVEACGLLNVRRGDLVVVEAERAGSAQGLESLVQPFSSRHLRVQLQRRARDIRGVQGTSLMRHLDEFGPHPALREEELRLLELLLVFG